MEQDLKAAKYTEMYIYQGVELAMNMNTTTNLFLNKQILKIIFNENSK